ncbi:hypothetical protein ABPG72_015460 [Tetrahymena utriculariae]
MSYSANQVKNPNGKLTVQITKADIYNTSQSYENIIVKIQIGNDVKVTPACSYSQKNIQWVDSFDVVRKENEDNFIITLINQSKKGDEVLGSDSIEINQFLQRARKTDFQADLQLNGKNTSSLQLKIQFIKFTDAENLALEAQKQAQSGKKVDSQKIQEAAINEASQKLRENEILTNYTNNPYAQSYKYLITITHIKANFKRDTDMFSKMDPFVRIKVSEDINFKTSVAKGGGKTPEWKEQVQVYVGLEEVIMFLVFDQEVHKDQLIGFGYVLMQNFKLGDETKVIPLEYHKQNAGELAISVNCKLVGSYEKSNNLLGKVVLRNVSSVLKKGQSNHQLKFSLGTENKCTHLVTKSEPNSKYRDIIVFPIKDKAQTNLAINLQTVSSKNVVDLVSSSSFDLKPIIENEKWYIQEEIIMMGKDTKEMGKIIADIQYIDLAEHEDEKLYKLQQNQGKITLKNMRGYLTRDTEMFGKMDPYCILKYNGIQLKTSVHQSGGKEPVWKDNIFELPQFTYQKDKQLFFEIFDEDTSKDDLIGKGQMDLSQFMQKKGKYLGQKVNIAYEGKQAGQINFDLEYEDNQELIAYIEKKKKEKEMEELQKKKAEEEMKAIKAKQDVEKKKKEDEEKKQKEEEEKKRKLLEEQELKKKQEEEEKKRKLLEEQELKKKQEEEEKKKKLLEEQELKKKQEEEQKKKKFQEEQDLKKKQEEEEKKKKLQEEQELKKKQEEDEKKKKLTQEQELKKKQEDDEKQKKKLQEEQELKKKQEEEERQKKEAEEKKRKEEEQKKKQEALQKEMELKRQNEEIEKARIQQENEEKRKQQEQEQKKLQENLSKSREYSPQGSQHSLNQYAEYKVAKQNMEQGHGFGMSEYQSATSLQKSIPAFSIPRSQRFKPSSSAKKEQSKGPDYVQLPSIFEQNTKKGVSFGHGQRGQREGSNSPGPGAYQKDSTLRTVKGFTFGVSRSNCKNYIDPEFASPKKTQKFESPEKQRRQHSSIDNRTMEYDQIPKQNDIYIQQNKYLQQQQNKNKRNASHDQRRNMQQQNIFYHPNQNNNRQMPQIRQQSLGQTYNQNNNNSNIVYSNNRHGNYHYTTPNDKNNKSYQY